MPAPRRLQADALTASRLTRRETEIIEALYRRGRATALEIQRELAEPPGYSAVRKLLEILEGKGLVRHERDGRRYIYEPVVPREDASVSALRRVVRSFFSGNASAAMVALLSLTDRRPTEAELRRIVDEAERARLQGG